MLDFVELPTLNDKRVATYSAAVRPLYVHGDLVIRGYTVVDFARWKQVCDDNATLFNTLINSLDKLLPELKTSEAWSPVPSYTMIAQTRLAEELSALLLSGGCYEKYPGTKTEARRTSQAFVSFMVEPDQNNAKIFAVREQWTPWFSPVIWAMYLIANPLAGRWFALCATDED